MIEELKNKIKEKKDELNVLNKQLSQERRELFNYMVGKCYKLTSTCIVKVNRIDSVDQDTVYVEGIVAYVYGDNTTVDFRRMESIGIIDIPSSEITIEEFLEIVTLSITKLQDKLKAVCY